MKPDGMKPDGMNQHASAKARNVFLPEREIAWPIKLSVIRPGRIKTACFFFQETIDNSSV